MGAGIPTSACRSHDATEFSEEAASASVPLVERAGARADAVEVSGRGAGITPRDAAAWREGERKRERELREIETI